MCVFAIFRVIAIHEKLSNLAQIAELSLPSVPEVASNENIYESVEPEEKAVDPDMEVSRLLSDSQMNLPLWDGSHHTSLFKLHTVYCVWAGLLLTNLELRSCPTFHFLYLCYQIWSNSCIYEYSHALAYVGVCACMWKPQVALNCRSWSCCPPCFSWQGASPTLELTNQTKLAGQWALGIVCFHLPSTGIASMDRHDWLVHFYFYHEFWGSNSGPHWFEDKHWPNTQPPQLWPNIHPVRKKGGRPYIVPHIFIMH